LPTTAFPVEDEVKVGDEIMVKVTEIDRMGRVNLSRRAVFQDSKGEGGGSAPSGPDRRPQGSRPPHGGGDRRSGGGPPRRYPDRGRKPINR